MIPFKPLRYGAFALGALLALAACDPQRIAELKPGVSNEADVRDRFGVPENTWPEADGGRTLEYNRQPAGQVNYMITLNPQGQLVEVRQVLTPAMFARVQAGMTEQEVRRLLGKPAKRTPYPLKNETEWDWRWQDGPNTPMVFTATFAADGRVLRTGSVQEVPAAGGK